MNNKQAVTYDDMLLVPRYSDITSRSEISISSRLGFSLVLDLPIIASPMDTISGPEMAVAMGDLGGLAIIHRYNSISDQSALVAQARTTTKNVGAAIGINEDALERAAALVAAGANVLCVDVAHGHHIKMKNTLSQLRKVYLKHGDVHIMAGNVCTLEGVNDLADWGADSVRCNIGGGAICSTRIQTGHGLPGLQTIFDCARTDRDVVIIADGGIRNSGDIVKALAAGADFVMCGSLLSGTDETPGPIVHLPNGEIAKEYRGMASRKAQMEWRGTSGSPEGVSSYIPYKGAVDHIMKDIIGGIRSGLSYSGARCIKELRINALWSRQTPAGTHESNTHINDRRID
jgi:IMP dehydrogenase